MQRKTYPSDAAIDDHLATLSRALEPWSIPHEALDRVHDAARASLAEVQALTAYQDGKASRLLTNVTFLSALVSAVFTRFASNVGWPGGPFALRSTYVLPAATAATFLLYVVLVTVAVLMILNAIRPSSVMPLSWRGMARDRPRSMLFYERILDVDPSFWARTFVDNTGSDAYNLKADYTKNYIAESYIMAEKVAIKIARLHRGISVLRSALLCLLVFLILFSVTTITVDHLPIGP